MIRIRLYCHQSLELWLCRLRSVPVIIVMKAVRRGSLFSSPPQHWHRLHPYPCNLHYTTRLLGLLLTIFCCWKTREWPDFFLFFRCWLSCCFCFLKEECYYYYNILLLLLLLLLYIYYPWTYTANVRSLQAGTSVAVGHSFDDGSAVAAALVLSASGVLCLSNTCARRYQ